MQKVLISMDDMPFLMTVIVGVKHISLTELHHAVKTCDNPSFYYYLQKDWDWSWIRLCALNPRFCSAWNAIRACAVNYLPMYVCVHETLYKSGHFHFPFFKRFDVFICLSLSMESCVSTHIWRTYANSKF